MKIIDISVPQDSHTIVWEGNKSPQVTRVAEIKKGNAHTESILTANLHSGTHIDAPLHFIRGGSSVEKIKLSQCIGAVFVVDVGDVQEIGVDVLKNILIPKEVRKILFKTSNSKLWGSKDRKFKRDYVGITTTAAEWLVKRKIHLIGVDYLSVAKYEEAQSVHNVLLQKQVIILEGINLSSVKSGWYELICLPVAITGAEAAPTRAILIKK